MCVRFLLEADIEELARNYRAQIADERVKSYSKGDFFPAQSAPVVMEQESRVITLAKWGFNYSLDKKLVINARSETIFRKPMFKDAAKLARCIIPANLFYEWKDEGSKKKAKYKIKFEEGGIMSFAGLYKASFDEKQESQLDFVIITTDAQDDVKEVHPRMPLIIKDEWVDIWLSKDTPVRLVEEILRERTGARFMVEKCENVANNRIKEGMREEQMRWF